MPRVRRGDVVSVRKGDAQGTGVKARAGDGWAAHSAYKGDISGCRGVVIGHETKADGSEVATVAATDFSRDGRPTGLLEVPVERLRHSGVRGVCQDVSRATRRAFAGAGASRVLHGNGAAHPNARENALSVPPG